MAEEDKRATPVKGDGDLGETGEPTKRDGLQTERTDSAREHGDQVVVTEDGETKPYHSTTHEERRHGAIPTPPRREREND